MKLSDETRIHCQWLWSELSGSIVKDVSVQSAEGDIFQFNKLVLAAFSPVLKQCLTDMDDDSNLIIILPDVKTEILQLLHSSVFSLNVTSTNNIDLLLLLLALGADVVHGYGGDSEEPVSSLKYEEHCNFTCTICNETFSSYVDVQKHSEENHKVEAGFHCDDCRQNFETLEGLSNHCKEVHGNTEYPTNAGDLELLIQETALFRVPRIIEKKYQCTHCEKKFSTKVQLTHHNNIHLGLKPYSCKICNKTFTQPTHLNIHMRVHSGSKPYMCSICGKTFAIASNMRKHQFIHERENIENKKELNCDEVNKGTEDLDQEEFVPMTNYPCDHCEASFATKRELMTHITNHDEISPFQCTAAGCEAKFPTEKKLAIHEKRQHNKQHSCNFCGKVCVSQSQLKKHVLIHTGDRPFKCNSCEKSFTQKSHVTFHQKTVHSKDGFDRKKHVCLVCGRGFSTKGVLNKHKMLHTNDRPFQCDVCSKSFVQKSHLKVHFAKHTGHRPFPCPECGKQFTTKHHLKEHSLLHSGSKPWFHCNQCDAKYRGQTDLATHIRTHTGETPYHCQQEGCGKSFRSLRSLENHIRVHTGSKPFRCQTCGKSFTTASGLRQHFKHNIRCQSLAKPGSFILNKTDSNSPVCTTPASDLQIQMDYDQEQNNDSLTKK